MKRLIQRHGVSILLYEIASIFSEDAEFKHPEHKNISDWCRRLGVAIDKHLLLKNGGPLQRYDGESDE